MYWKSYTFTCYTDLAWLVNIPKCNWVRLSLWLQVLITVSRKQQILNALLICIGQWLAEIRLVPLKIRTVAYFSICTSWELIIKAIARLIFPASRVWLPKLIMLMLGQHMKIVKTSLGSYGKRVGHCVLRMSIFGEDNFKPFPSRHQQCRQYKPEFENLPLT